MSSAPVRIAVSGIDGSGKSTLCKRLEQWLAKQGRTARVVGNLPRAYRGANQGVVDPSDPFLSSFFFNYAAEHGGDPGGARFLFDPRYVDYVMAIEEARLYRETTLSSDPMEVVIHDRHVLDRRVNAYRAGSPRTDIDTILGHVLPPALTVLLDLPAETAVERVRLRGKPGRDENVADLSEYREIYRSCASAEQRLLFVDAGRDPQEVFETVLPHVCAVLGGVGLVAGRTR